VTSSSQPLCRVLVVDDEPMLVHLMAKGLKDAGYDVTPFGSGPEALEALTGGERFDVVVSDVRMPGVDGHTIARTALAMPHQPAVVLVTGYQDPELALPFLATLNKPFPMNVLVQTVHELAATRPCATEPRPAARQTS
jgi:CheY-like chemotaxis protein